MGIQIISAGAFTTVQDYGRMGYGDIGFAPSGAMDVPSMELGNLLVGNCLGEAVLECTMSGPTIRFMKDTVICVTGAYMAPKIEGKAIPMNCAVSINAGEQLELGVAHSGCRSYIAFAGGLVLQDDLGSKSTNIKGKIGGFYGRALKANDEIPFINPVKILPDIKKRVYPVFEALASPRPIRVVLGPQDDYFTKEGIETFLNSFYELTIDVNRMACKLSGPSIASMQGYDIISDGISLGSIQVSSNGQPIIMLSDRQTTGGYAKIATVISIDIPYIAQLRPGDAIRFFSISLEEAHKRYKDYIKQRRKLQKKWDKVR